MSYRVCAPALIVEDRYERKTGTGGLRVPQVLHHRPLQFIILFTMSRFDYKDHPVISRVERISVSPAQDYPDILRIEALNRVQKVLEIRKIVRDGYIARGFRDVNVRFIDGSVQDMIDSSKIEGRPLPDTLFFDVELVMPRVEQLDSNARMKTGEGTLTPAPSKDDQDRSYKDYGAYNQNDHLYWT